MLHLVALLLMAAARRLPHTRVTALRLAIANIHRPGALTPTIVLSLGLGLALLVTVIEIDGNLRRQFMAALPERAPSFYFVDIQSADADRFDAFVRERAPGAQLERVPMLRGRIVAANGVKAEDLKPPPSAAWVLQSDRGITYGDEVPAGSRAGRRPVVGAGLSGTAADLVREEDRRRSRAQDRRPGRPSTCSAATSPRPSPTCAPSTGRASASISCWCFRPMRFAGAPHTHIATLTYPGGGSAGDGDRAAQGGRRCFPDGHHRARQGGARRGRRPCAQPRARDPRRERRGADRGGAGAGRRARGRPPPSGLRRGRAQDARRDARAG